MLSRRWRFDVVGGALLSTSSIGGGDNHQGEEDGEARKRGEARGRERVLGAGGQDHGERVGTRRRHRCLRQSRSVVVVHPDQHRGYQDVDSGGPGRGGRHPRQPGDGPTPRGGVHRREELLLGHVAQSVRLRVDTVTYSNLDSNPAGWGAGGKRRTRRSGVTGVRVRAL